MRPKTRLSQLLRLVDAGQEVEILRSGEPVAKIVPFKPRVKRQFGVDHGAFTVTDDFDAPLPDEVLESFYG
jgi:prevent-host-death family protein